jgi:hypothetical protein
VFLNSSRGVFCRPTAFDGQFYSAVAFVFMPEFFWVILLVVLIPSISVQWTFPVYFV